MGRLRPKNEGCGRGLAGFLELAFEGMFGALPGFREIAIGAVLHRVFSTMSELISHGVVAGLSPFIGFLGTLSAVGVVLEMVADTLGHVSPFGLHVLPLDACSIGSSSN